MTDLARGADPGAIASSVQIIMPPDALVGSEPTGGIGVRPRLRALGAAVGLGALLWALAGSGCITEREIGRVILCGNGSCDRSEDPIFCPQDCLLGYCGNHLCELPETPRSCPQDCPQTACGDGHCEVGENPVECEQDCPWSVVGNHACEEDETPATAPTDCMEGYCGNGLCELPENSIGCPSDCAPTRAADVLVVVDNSGSMEEEQEILRAGFGELLAEIRGAFGDIPELHVGVISSDLGVGAASEITNCEGAGDQGRLLGDATALGGRTYMVDVAPWHCDVLREPDGTCSYDSCSTDEHCAHESGTHIVHDQETGCPRCRNFDGPPSEAFSAMADLGITGCGFEQPLEAMYRALDSNPFNTGFLREDALLAVIFITDEDDCSASDIQLFGDPEAGMDSTLGPLTSFRCFEFGITCEVDGRATGTRQGCIPRSDSEALLYPIQRYASFLSEIKDPGRVVLSVFAGPVPPGGEVQVGLDARQRPVLEPSCTVPDRSRAIPAIRLRTLAGHFNDPWSLQSYAFQSICEPSFQTPLGRVGRALKSRMTY